MDILRIEDLDAGARGLKALPKFRHRTVLMDAARTLGRVVFALLALAVVAGSGCSELAAGWTNIRDGVFYFRVSSHCCVRGAELSWTPAWIADSQTERIYFQAPNGDLIARKIISRENTRGTFDLAYQRGLGDYRLEIPGYSFRDYRVDSPARLPVVFEPVKLHFSMSARTGQTLYFKVPARKPFSLGGKYHDGVRALHIEPVAGGRRVSLELRQHGVYSDFDRTTIPARSRDHIWRLTFEGSGKAAFWLDGVANRFALAPEHLFEPELKPGTVEASVGADVIGSAPAIGTYFDFEMPSERELSLIEQAGFDAANFYFFEDVLTRNIDHDLEFLRAYERRLRIDDYVSILSWTTRDSISTDIGKSLDFTRTYLRHHRGRHGLEIPYVALVDEPNLRYDSFEDFERDFVTMATALEDARDPAISAVKLAAPESSRMLNGPTSEEVAEQDGLDWTTRLLERHWSLFDAVSWHEWMVRDLIATDWYRDSIEQVWRAMTVRAPEGAAPKPLMITQTNMSSGLSLSPYEQDTFYAALWWTSVIAQSTNTGKLAMLNWFKALNYPPYEKGIMKMSDDEPYALKPVGHAMAFIHPAVLDYTLPVRDESVEVDMAATMDKGGGALNLFGVNKAERYQDVSVIVNQPQKWRGETFKWRATSMDAKLVRSPLVVSGAPEGDRVRLSFKLAPESLWVIEFQ